ncbi:MAG TPA: GNAT family N-acetyltransferase [Gaiellaceae bacterium]
MGQAAVGPPVGYEARAPSPADADAVAGLLRATELEDFGEAEADAGELAKDWETFDLPRDAVIVCAGDEVAGYGYFFRRGGEQAIIDVYVDPRHQGRGIGSFLIDELERRAGDVERIGSGVATSNAVARRLLQRRGYRFVRRFWRMTVDLHRHPPPPEWPGEIVPTRYLPRDEHAIWSAIEEAFHDHWEYRPEPFEDWRRRTVDRPGFDPTLWIVAKDGPEVVGVALAREQPRGGRIDTLAVRREWRRRGLARAILLEAFGEFHRRGDRTVILSVDSENLTGATRLYEQAGMRVSREIDAFERVLR